MSLPNWQAMDGTTLLHELEQYSVQNGISDIHFSPEKQAVRLEVRLHGVLTKLGDIPHPNYLDLTRRVKFIAKLKLNVTDVPQDGQYTFQATKTVEGKPDTWTVNVRVASIPSRFGETYTLRLLDPKRGIVPLEQLGFPVEIHNALKELVALPHGLVLVTGPTGSGKTTTLYALLNTIVGKERNIITLEDPVEYELKGIVQSQVNPTHDYTFATGLRSILRHDPDVILVGEIRDFETAQTAVDAALTGHLVLSTLHTNSAIEAIPRLLSMGVTPYTFAPALRAILAQRLIRTLKPEFQKEGATYDPADNASYSGQVALPELLQVSPALRSMILTNETSATLEEQAKKEGYKTMKDWGDILSQGNVTARSEIDRVTS